VNLPTLKQLAAQKPGSPGRKRADAWLWSWADDRWAHDQCKLITLDASQLIRHFAILVPKEAGHWEVAINPRLPQWAITYLGTEREVKPSWRKIIVAGQLMRPSDFFRAFGLPPMPADYIPA